MTYCGFNNTFPPPYEFYFFSPLSKIFFPGSQKVKIFEKIYINKKFTPLPYNLLLSNTHQTTLHDPQIAPYASNNTRTKPCYPVSLLTSKKLEDKVKIVIRSKKVSCAPQKKFTGKKVKFAWLEKNICSKKVKIFEGAAGKYY